MIEPIYVEDLNKVYVPIPKVAHSTLKRAIKVRHGWERWDGKGDPEIVVMWRAPEDRFESAWTFLTQSSPRRRACYQAVPFYDWGMELMRRPNFPHDIHIQPMNEWEPEGRIKRIPWDFEAFAAEFDLPLPLEVRNPSERKKVKWPGDMRALFERRYARDLEIWGRMD